MIFRLDSIEEESMLVEDKSPEQTQARSWSKNHKLREFDNDLSELEHKLKNFEEKVITIQKKNKEFEHKMPPID